MARGNALGDLLIRLGLDDAEYKTGLTKAEAQAAAFQRKFDAQMQSAGRAAGVAFGLIATAGVAAFAILHREVEKVASFKQLSEQLGDTAENIAGLAVIAATSGVSLESVAAASIKLTAGLSKSDDETKGAAAAIKNLGLNFDEFLKLTPVEKLEAIAKQLDAFADGEGKTAFAVAAFGKAGAAVLPFLNDLADANGRQIKLTQEQIELADRYTKQQARTKAELERLLQLVAVESLHAFTSFTGALTDTAKAMLGVDKESKNLMGNDIKEWADTAARSLAFVVDAGDGVGRTFQIAGKSIGSFLAAREQLFKGNVRGALDTLFSAAKDVDDILSRPLFSDRLEKRLAATPPPKAPARPVLDPRRFAAESGGTKDVDEYGKAIEALGKSAATSMLELNAFATGTGDVSDAMKTLARIQGDKVWSEFNDEQRKTIIGAYEGLDAIQRRTDAFKAERSEREKLIRAYEQQAEAQERAREQITQSLGTYAEQNSALERQLAIVGQDDLAHQKLAATLEYEALKARALAAEDELTALALEKQYQRRLQLLDSFDKANKVLEQQRSIKEGVEEVGNAFGHAAEDALIFGRTTKDVLKALEQDLLRIGTRDLVTKPLSNAFTNLVTGSSGGSGGGSWITALLSSFTGSGSSPGAGWTSGFDLPIGGAAAGTSFASGGPTVVGERGWEIVNLPRGSQVIPHEQSMAMARQGRGPTVNQYITNMPGNDRRSRAQQGNEAWRRAEQAVRVR